MVQRPLFPKKVTCEELNSLVDRAADLIRIVDHKFILVLLFLQRLSDVWRIKKQQVKERMLKGFGLSEGKAGG